MDYRNALAELLGPEYCELPVTIGSRTQTLRFRLILDAEAQQLYAPRDDELAADKGLRIMRGLVVASLVDEDGAPMLTAEEAAGMRLWQLRPIYDAACIANGLRAPDGDAQPSTAPDGEAPQEPPPNA